MVAGVPSAASVKRWRRSDRARASERDNVELSGVAYRKSAGRTSRRRKVAICGKDLEDLSGRAASAAPALSALKPKKRRKAGDGIAETLAGEYQLKKKSGGRMWALTSASANRASAAASIGRRDWRMDVV